MTATDGSEWRYGGRAHERSYSGCTNIWMWRTVSANMVRPVMRKRNVV